MANRRTAIHSVNSQKWCHTPNTVSTRKDGAGLAAPSSCSHKKMSARLLRGRSRVYQKYGDQKLIGATSERAL